jgi:hypothetical protein
MDKIFASNKLPQTESKSSTHKGNNIDNKNIGNVFSGGDNYGAANVSQKRGRGVRPTLVSLDEGVNEEGKGPRKKARGSSLFDTM